jgi:hypothetical protein
MPPYVGDIVYVRRYSMEWTQLVEQGWVTMTVDGLNTAKMVYQPEKKRN